MRRLRGSVGPLVAFLVILSAPAGALAQSVTHTPAVPTIEGEVVGRSEARGTLSFAVDVIMPGGWEALQMVEILVRSGGRELERISYDVEDGRLKVGDQEIVVGTGGVAGGEYLRVSGEDVVVTTGGGNLSFDFAADVLRPLPDDARFDLVVTDDLGAVTSVTRGLGEGPTKWLTVGTVITSVLLALLVGGVMGNLFASRRRSPSRFSVYDAIDRRLQAEREG